MVTSTVTKSRLRAVLSFLFILLLSASALGQGGKKTTVPEDPGRGATIWSFEVDADFRTGFIPSFWNPIPGTTYNPSYYPNTTTYGTDWRSLLTYNGTTNTFSTILAGDLRTVGKVDGNWGNKSDAPEFVSFAGESNKNSDLIGPGLVTASYKLQAGGTGPQKNDITNTFLHSLDYNDSVVLVYAVETRATNGASFVDFEYNQAGVKIDSSNGLHLVGNGLVGGRTVGDFLLIVDYVGGGATPIVSARTWLASGQWSDSIGVDQLRAFIAANSQDVQALSNTGTNLSSYADDGAPSGTCKALQMVEGAVNLTYLKSKFPGFAALNLCSPNATVTVKTRSSPSFTSELKDLDIIPFSIIPGPPGTNTSQTVCPDTIGGTYGTFNLTAVKNIVVGAGGHVVNWYKDVAFAQLISDSLSYTAPNGTVVYAKLENSEGCESMAADTLKVFNSPVGTNTSQSSCPDDIGGTTATFNLKLKNSTVTGGAAGVIVNGWFTAYDPATNAFSGPIADSAAYSSGNTTIYARLKSANNCYGVAADTLKVFTSPVGTNTSQALCSDAIGGTTATFNLTSKNSTVTGGATGVIVDGWFTGYNATTDAFSGPIADSAAYSSGNATIYARLKSANNCYGVAADTLKVFTSPPGTHTSQALCPDDIGGTTATFNLTSKNTTVTGGDVNVSVVGWFGGYNSATGVFSSPIATPAAFSSGNAIVYAKLSSASNCFGFAADTLTVFTSPAGTNTSQDLCPDDIGGTTATFNLASKNSTVTGGVAGVSVDKWFTGYNSATDAFTGEITTPSAYSSGNAIVYARLINTDGCYGVAADTLTVFTSPGKPAVAYNAPACDVATFTVTVSSVVQGATYYIKDKNGAAIPGVSPASGYVAPNANNFNFSNIPAGAGYQVWVMDLNGCLSDTTSCGSPSQILTKTATAPEQKQEVITEKQTDQKAMAISDIKAIIGAQTKATAAPNPFTDKVRFTLESAVSGQGSLEIFNTLGQKIHTVYQGYIEAGKPLTKEYVVPRAQRANLIYIFRVGEQKATGKLLNR